MGLEWAARESVWYEWQWWSAAWRGCQPRTSYLFLFTGFAPTVAAVGCDAQEEVGGHRCDGYHEAHECDEEVIIQGQGQVTSLEALLSEREEWGTLNFRGAPALSQLRICNTEPREGERPGEIEWNGEDPPYRKSLVSFVTKFLLTFFRPLNSPQGKYFYTHFYRCGDHC